MPGLTADLGSPAGQGPNLRGGGQEGRGDQHIGGMGLRVPGGSTELAPLSSGAPGLPSRGSVSALWQGSPDPDDPADADLIRAVVNQGAPQLHACYTQRLNEHPTLEGRLAIDLDIVRGRVLRVDIAENGTGDAILEDCVQRRVRAWRFPIAVTAQAVLLPFSLVPR